MYHRKGLRIPEGPLVAHFVRSDLGESQVDVDATTADSGLEILFASVRTRIYAHTT